MQLILIYNSEDFKNTRYDIVCDSIDCVMRIVKNDDKITNNNFGIKRNCILLAGLTLARSKKT